MLLLSIADDIEPYGPEQELSEGARSAATAPPASHQACPRSLWHFVPSMSSPSVTLCPQHVLALYDTLSLVRHPLTLLLKKSLPCHDVATPFWHWSRFRCHDASKQTVSGPSFGFLFCVRKSADKERGRDTHLGKSWRSASSSLFQQKRTWSGEKKKTSGSIKKHYPDLWNPDLT